MPAELVFDRQESGECTNRVLFPALLPERKGRPVPEHRDPGSQVCDVCGETAAGERQLVCGLGDNGYVPEVAARACLRDLPGAELQLLDRGGHWLLETHLDKVVALFRDFLGRVHAA
ncbi:hypothetical protein [Streptomyces sp. NPDC000851]